MRVAERFIRHIVGSCLLVVHILNRLLSVPKTNCVLFVSGAELGNYLLQEVKGTGSSLGQ